MRLHGDLDALVRALARQADIAINKPGKMLNPVQNRLNLQLDKLAFRLYLQPIEISIGAPKASLFLSPPERGTGFSLPGTHVTFGPRSGG